MGKGEKQKKIILIKNLVGHASPTSRYRVYIMYASTQFLVFYFRIANNLSIK